MSVQKTRLAIELAPDRIEVARLRGHHVIGASRQWLAPDKWEAAWQEGLQPLDGPLIAALKALGVQSGTADVFHHGPDATSELCSHMLPPDAARQATILAMADQVGVGLADHPHDVRVLSNSRSDDGKRQSHVLFTSDSEQSAEAISNWLARAGVDVGRIVPVQSSHMSALIRLAGSITSEPTVVLRFGEHKAAIAVVVQGKVRLARSLALGIARLTESLARTITTHDEREVTLNHDEARAMLFEHGIPQRGDIIQPWNLKATDVLPAMQPVLQRCLVELRQSVRFGLGHEHRSTARLLVIGPGAAIPRLAEVLGSELSLQAEAHSTANFRHDEPACPASDLADAISTPIQTNLLPSSTAQARTMARLRTALLTGAAAAFVIGSAQAMMWSATASEISSRASTFTTQVAQVHELESLRDRAAARSTALTALELAIERSLGPTPGIAGFLRELPALVPSTVHVLDLRCSRDEQGARIDIIACATAPDPKSHDKSAPAPTKQITDLVARLEQSALIDRVQLGNTQSTVLDTKPAMQFTLNIHLLGVPARLTALGELSEVAP